jgi:hypothetical protein
MILIDMESLKIEGRLLVGLTISKIMFLDKPLLIKISY